MLGPKPRVQARTILSRRISASGSIKFSIPFCIEQTKAQLARSFFADHTDSAFVPVILVGMMIAAAGIAPMFIGR
jgi:hypothetical protein